MNIGCNSLLMDHCTQPTDVQQLKAEIALLCTELEECKFSLFEFIGVLEGGPWWIAQQRLQRDSRAEVQGSAFIAEWLYHLRVTN